MNNVLKMKKILFIEDDPIIAQSVVVNLELEGYACTHVTHLAEALKTESSMSFDLALIDVGLPDGTGFSFCREMTKKGNQFPMIILTAQIDEESVIEGLEAGADDYVKKPFSTRELMARIKVCLRVPQREGAVLRFGDLSLDVERRQAFFQQAEIELNKREFDLLKIFILRPEMVFTRESLIEKLSTTEEISDRTIDSHISHLRTKLKSSGNTRVLIQAEYGVGYRLTQND